MSDENAINRMYFESIQLPCLDKKTNGGSVSSKIALLWKICSTIATCVRDAAELTVHPARPDSAG